MAKISEIKLPNNSVYQLKDNGALQLTGGTVTGSVNFEDSVYISDLNAGNLVVTGNAAFTNNIQANTINGVEVGSNPKFTDTGTVTSVAAAGTNGITISGSPITSAGTITIGLNLSNAINGLGEGASPANRNDYAVVQFAGGGTTTTSYHRRKLSNVFAALNSTDITKALGGNQNANLVFAGPSSGSAATPSFRALVAADIPNLAWSKITSGNDDLKAIENLTGTSGFLKKTAANTWTLDTSTYLTGITSSQVTSALGFTPYNATNPNGYTSNTGTVTSVRVQANPPLQSSTSTAQSSSLNTTISFVNQNANVVLAGPSSGNAAAPTFRALVAADIPSLSKSKISDFPTSMPPTAHTHAYIVTEGDNRSLATTPNDYTSAKGQHPNRIVFRGLKSNSSINSPSSDTYSYLVGLRGWSDSSGGDAYEIAFNDTGIFVRKGATTTWGNWERLYTSGNLTKTVITNLGIPAQDTTYTFDGTYNASTNKAATVNTVTNAINNLDGNLNNTTPGVGKTLTAFSQTNGKISATFGNISITKSQISDFPSTMTPAAHTHDDRYYTETEINNKFTALTNTTTQINYIKFYSGSCNAGKTYIGWIKIASFPMNNSNQLGQNSYEFGIYRSYTSPSSESYNIKINTGWNNASIIQLNGRAGTQIIEKFRLVKDNTNHIGYFEMYVNTNNATSQNNVSLRIQQWNYELVELTLLNTVQTEAESDFQVVSTLDLKPKGIVSNNNFYGNLIGNADTTTEFSSNATVTLTGDTTGTSAGSKKSWSITTTTKKLSQTATTALSSFTDTTALIYTAAGGSNTIADKPTSVDAFGCLSFKTAEGWYGQLLMSSNAATGLYWRTATNLSGSWKKLLDSNNYTDYTVTKTGEGANGTWGIDITGNAATSKYLMNRGSNAVSINDSTWGVSIISQGHTIRDKVWHQQWKQSGLKFTPQGGSESNITDSADLVYYLSSSNTTNSLTLNMAIDGIVYAGLGFKGAWNGNTISIAKGGTGQTTAKNAINALLNGLDTWTANPTDDTYFIRQDTNGAANYGKVKFSTIWNYIKTKTNASFNPGSLTITMDTTDKKKALIKFTAPSFS